MKRRDFLIRSNALFAAAFLSPKQFFMPMPLGNIGVQLYSFREQMLEDATGTLKLIADIGFKEVESARSQKGLYYGLSPAEMKKVCADLGLKIRSGHVHLDEDWQNTMNQAAEAGQEYVICSTMPSDGQTVDNYKQVAEAFNVAGEDCKALGLKFGYHNHEYEFEREGGQTLYDVLMDETDPSLVHMELDLGWVVASGQDPLDYFTRYKGRFPLWHLKDMDLWDKKSTEFGKGGLDIKKMMDSRDLSGVKHIFIEQEEYASNPEASMRHNLKYLSDL